MAHYPAHDVFKVFSGRIIKLVEEPGAPEEKVTGYTYDASGRILTLTKPDGITLLHTYDALGRLIHLKSSDGTVSYAYTYDLNNNLLEAQDEVSYHTSIYGYDAWNRTLTDGIMGRFTQSFTYDALGRLTSLTAPDSLTVDYTYEESRLRNISWRGLEHHYNTFDKKGRPLESSMIARLGTHSTSWDKKGRITNIASAYFTQEIPQDGFDAVGNLKKCFFTDAIGQINVTAAYDDLYQLTQETGVQEHSYTNDSISNRRTKNDSAYTLDSTNKLLSDAEHDFVYDKNGNLIEQRSRSKTIHFTYDALDRLIKVNDGTQETSYLYDNFHRRIARSINGKKPQYFLHLGQREVGVWDADTKVLKEYRVLGLGKGAEMGASVAIELDGKMYCPLHDHRGNIIGLVDILTGKIAESYRYTAFGECETYNHKQQQIPKSAVNNSWGFASKRLDAETGFVYFSRRYYAPPTGRWVTPDPLGFADGPNMYAYVHGNPMTRFDLYGLLSVEIERMNQLGGSSKGGNDIFEKTRPVNESYSNRGNDSSYKYDRFSNMSTGSAWDTFKEKAPGFAYGAFDAMDQLTYATMLMPHPVVRYSSMGLNALCKGGKLLSNALRSPTVQRGLKPIVKHLVHSNSLTQKSASVTRAVAGKQFQSAQEFVNLASESRTNHIIFGEGVDLGGHLWPGAQGKTAFPSSWGPEKIMHQVSDVATDPAIGWKQLNGKAGSSFTNKGRPVRYEAVG